MPRVRLIIWIITEFLNSFLAVTSYRTTFSMGVGALSFLIMTSYTKLRGEWKVGLKLNIQKTKIMAASPITSW